MPPASTPRYNCYAVTAPGLEPVTETELTALGMEMGVSEPGGIPFRADAAELYAANLHLRTASRVIVRVAEFEARSFRDLETKARVVPWERFVVPGRAVQLRVTCRKSRLYHSDAVAERVRDAISHRLGVPTPTLAAADDESEGGEAQLFVVRFNHDRCTISADASGRLLHLRGYRQAVGRAPLRETLAAAMLLGSGWDPEAPLLDPMCGSGTIAIEGAMLARQIAPGLRRSFAFENWPEFRSDIWAELRAAANAAVQPAALAPIQASDRDAGAIAATIANAERAGVASDITATQQALSSIDPVRAPIGWLVTNPPYGHRVGDVERLRALYARLGQVAYTLCPGWIVAILVADQRLEGQVNLPFEDSFRTSNGGIWVRLAVATVPQSD